MIVTENRIKQKIELCKSVHNNKYSYDKVKYVNHDTNVIITCPIHGDFEQTLYSHSVGRGCRKCSYERMATIMRKDKDDFVERSNIIHNHRYSYDKVPNSFKVRNKVTITCQIHGDFEQAAHSHKNGSGCPFCFGKFGSNFERRDDARKNNINFSIKNYEFDHVKLLILSEDPKGRSVYHCDIHGEFTKNISQVIKGQICTGCLISRNRKIATQNELNKMLNQHNNRFEYPDYVDLVSPKTKITIRCKEHDYTFKCTKSTHLSNKFGGCPHCLKKYRDNSKSKEQDLVINQFKIIHGDRYGYDNVNYQRSDIKVSITCDKHGDFLQTPSLHLRGSGCPKCKHSSGEKIIQNLLKKMGIHYTTQKSFYGCINDKTNRPLPFDMYVPEFHTCIEFDGHHHFIPIEGWGGEEKLKETQHRDNIKNVYCKENDINLIRIPYTMTRNEMVDLLNKSFDKNLIVETARRIKWIDINIRDRVKDYKTREEFRKKDNSLWFYCYKHKILDLVCEHMVPKKNRYTYESAKKICEQYTDHTLLEKEHSGLISYIRKNKFFELVEHTNKRRSLWTDEEILSELSKYQYKMDVRENDRGLYRVALRTGYIKKLKDKTIWWTEQMVIDAFKKCRSRSELTKKYRGAENYAVKHGIFQELSSHFRNKKVTDEASN